MYIKIIIKYILQKRIFFLFFLYSEKNLLRIKYLPKKKKNQ